MLLKLANELPISANAPLRHGRIQSVPSYKYKIGQPIWHNVAFPIIELIAVIDRIWSHVRCDCRLVCRVGVEQSSQGWCILGLVANFAACGALLLSPRHACSSATPLCQILCPPNVFVELGVLGIMLWCAGWDGVERCGEGEWHPRSDS
jgi:hypothetical protein